MLAGCGGGDDPGGTADARASSDAGGDVCDGAGPLSIGACVLGDGSPCTSVTDTDAVFRALTSGDTVDLVVGFQGATMLALAVRADGIEPGTDGGDDRPRIDLGLDNADGARISSYFNGVAFDSVDADTFEWRFVFLVVPGAGAELTGQTLTASGNVTDTNGQVRCGAIEIEAGAL